MEGIFDKEVVRNVLQMSQNILQVQLPYSKDNKLRPVFDYVIVYILLC